MASTGQLQLIRGDLGIDTCVFLYKNKVTTPLPGYFRHVTKSLLWNMLVTSR
uniref:Uncharacterized protein n=1 Tax=Picea sitchensis TaxID=3332 RepID=D5AB49_PICSI|nr:unknown [Picea sitchensis]